MEPWQVLGVGPHATLEEIDTAYKARARVLHPDLNRGASPAEQTSHNAAMAELNAARDAMRGRAGTRNRPAAGRQPRSPVPTPAREPTDAPPPWPTEPSEPAAAGAWWDEEPAGRRPGPVTDDPAWRPSTAPPPGPAGARRGVGTNRGFFTVVGIGVGGAVLVIGAIAALIGLANTFGDGSTKAPAPGGASHAIALGDCIARGDTGFDAVPVDCALPHLGRVTGVVTRGGVCPDGTEFLLTVDGDPNSYCIDAAS
jgi:DnaJ domain